MSCFVILKTHKYDYLYDIIVPDKVPASYYNYTPHAHDRSRETRQIGARRVHLSNFKRLADVVVKVSKCEQLAIVEEKIRMDKTCFRAMPRNSDDCSRKMAWYQIYKKIPTLMYNITL